MSAETIRLDPQRETPVTGRQGKRFGYRYAYARSADSRATADPGQDFLLCAPACMTPTAAGRTCSTASP